MACMGGLCAAILSFTFPVQQLKQCSLTAALRVSGGFVVIQQEVA